MVTTLVLVRRLTAAVQVVLVSQPAVSPASSRQAKDLGLDRVAAGTKLVGEIGWPGLSLGQAGTNTVGSLVNRLKVWAVWVGLLAMSAAGQDLVFITEFMAANTHTLADRDRDYPDWIELYNAGTNTVNLAGWALTDDPQNLTRWRFPAVQLAPNEYLLVFASGKDRRIPGAELHTNFKLDAGGEYLALVKPDGKTIACQFAPTYPPQQADVSYGLSMGDRAMVWVPSQAPKRVWVPTADVGLSWTTLEFDDRQWQVVTNGVGYDPTGLYGPFLGADLRAAMLGRSASVYLRMPFVRPDSGANRLKLRLRYDDGFVAYLNGWEVARRNAPKPLRWDSTATAAHGVPVPTVLEENFESHHGPYVLMWTEERTQARIAEPNEGSAGRFLRLINGQVQNQVAAVAFGQVASGQFQTVTAEFEFRWRARAAGGARLVGLLLPVSTYGSKGPGVDLATLRNQAETSLPGVLTVVLEQESAGAPAMLSAYWNRMRYGALTLAPAAVAPREFHQIKLVLEHTAEGAYVTASLTPRSRSPASVGLKALDRTFIRGLQPYPARLQIAAKIRDWDQTIDLDNVRMQWLPQSGMVIEEFDLAQFSDLLRPGTNLLAIHGLNRSATDPSFLLQPELVIAQGALQPGSERFFAQPTPRAPNGEGYASCAPAPIVSVRGGVFKEPVTVELRSPVTNGVVRYTLNGTEPTASSELAQGPIRISACAQLRAKTFVPGQLPSPTLTETYTLLDESLADFSSNLPLLIIHPFGKYISAYSKTPVGLRVIDTQNGRSTLTGPADYDGRATIHVRGFSTLRQPKSSYTVNLRDAHGDKLRVSLLGLPKEADWVLYAPYSDKSLMRDVLAYELSNQMGRYAPRTRFVEVFVHRYGARLNRSDYQGVYVLAEKITRSKNRVNIHELTPADNAEPAISGGYIIKRDHSQRREPGFTTSLRGVEFSYVYPEPDEITPQQRAWIARYMNELERAIYGPDFKDPNKGYAAYLDVDSFIDHHWLVEMSKNIDGLRYSVFLHKDRGGKLVVGPPWDWNLSWGNADYQEGWRTEGWYYELLREHEICWFRRLSQDPDFRQRAIDRWWQLRQHVFNTSNIWAQIDQWAQLLEEAQQRNFRRWPILGRRVNPNYFVGRTYQEEIRWLKDWIAQRNAWIDSQLLAPPTVTQTAATSTNAVTLTLSSSAGRIFYTLNGTDPRLPGGAVHPNAQLYQGPVAIGGPVRLFARVHAGSEWSGPTVAEFKPHQ